MNTNGCLLTRHRLAPEQSKRPRFEMIVNQCERNVEQANEDVPYC